MNGSGDRSGGEQLEIPKNTSGSEKRAIRQKSQSIRRCFRMLGIAALLIPTCALIGPSLNRQIEKISYQISLLEETSYGGEYDPTGGEEVYTENSRALVIVHKGHGEEVFPLRYENDNGYQDYLRRVEAIENIYRENNDPVVRVVTDYAISQGYQLEPRENVLYLVTDANNGMAMISIRQGKYNYLQNQQNVWDVLKAVGVKDVEIAGEFRGACPSQIEKYAEASGLNTWWSADATYPVVDQPEDLVEYPAIPPLK